MRRSTAAGLLSSSENLTQKANLYAAYSQILPAPIKELLISKIAG